MTIYCLAFVPFARTSVALFKSVAIFAQLQLLKRTLLCVCAQLSVCPLKQISILDLAILLPFKLIRPHCQLTIHTAIHASMHSSIPSKHLRIFFYFSSHHLNVKEKRGQLHHLFHLLLLPLQLFDLTCCVLPMWVSLFVLPLTSLALIFNKFA